MKKLPLEKQYGGDGLTANPVILRQVTRSDHAAVYSRASTSQPDKVYGYEVIKVKVVPAGTSLPGGAIVEEDYESYPGSKSFGMTGWFISGPNAEERAINLFNELNLESGKATATPNIKPETKATTAASLTAWPDGEFTINEIVAKTGQSYPETRSQVLEAVNIGNLLVAGKRKAAGGRGKPSILYRQR